MFRTRTVEIRISMRHSQSMRTEPLSLRIQQAILTDRVPIRTRIQTATKVEIKAVIKTLDINMERFALVVTDNRTVLSLTVGGNGMWLANSNLFGDRQILPHPGDVLFCNCYKA